MTGVVTGLYRYPVKGLSADPLQHVTLEAGQTLPFDRAWAIENGPTRLEPDAPAYRPPSSFLTLKRDERLAALQTRFEEEARRLVISRGGRPVASGDLTTPVGRQVLEQFIAAFMADSLRGRPKIVSAPGHSFSDTREKRVHVISLRSLRELERVVGRPVDPLRFRPNVILDGPEPWAEFDWIGRDITAGPVSLRISSRTERCAATNVDPATGVRDMAIPASLQREWGHTDFGIYAEVLNDGSLSVGDGLSL
ncbi:MOSC domain-containing protein [Hyphomicrobium sp.]|uniref:MOSC domain-containing protein n=1 Tax=Hyphomicrobium sp. TaxID=82 RepID=UPI003F70FBAD